MLPNHQAATETDLPKRSASRLERAVEFLLDPIVLLTVVHLSILALGCRFSRGSLAGFPACVPSLWAPGHSLLGLAAVPVLGFSCSREYIECEPVRVDFGADSFRARTPTRFRGSEGQGFDGIRRTIVTSGHAEFATSRRPTTQHVGCGGWI